MFVSQKSVTLSRKSSRVRPSGWPANDRLIIARLSRSWSAMKVARKAGESARPVRVWGREAMMYA